MSVTTYYLQMTHPGQLRTRPMPAELTVVECEIPQWRFNRFLYQLVGGPWQWADRLALPDAVWEAEIASPDHRTLVAYHCGAIAGYYELRRDAADVEILYFGLAPDFIGQGFGGPLLGDAIKTAWEWGTMQRVWVHTCSLDHPGALANYQARGLELYRETVSEA